MLISSGVIATQLKMYRLYSNEMLRMYLGGTNEQFSHTLSYWVTVVNNAKNIISNPKALIFGRRVP